MIMIIWGVGFGIITIMSLYCSIFFYRAKNGKLRKSIMYLFFGMAVVNFFKAISFGNIEAEVIRGISIIIMISVLAGFIIIINQFKVGEPEKINIKDETENN